MAQAIYEVDQALAKSLENLQNFSNQLRQIQFNRFDYLQEQISQFGSEADFYINVMENKPLTDENGLTQYGTATIGLHYQKSQIYQEQAKQYGEEIEKLEEEIKKNPADTALIEQKQKYVELQQESILNSEKEQQAIGDLVKQGYQFNSGHGQPDKTRVPGADRLFRRIHQQIQRTAAKRQKRPRLSKEYLPADRKHLHSEKADQRLRFHDRQ